MFTNKKTHIVCVYIYIYNLPKFAYLVICSFIYSYMYYNNSLTWNTVIFWDSYPNPKRYSSENSEVVPALFHHPFTQHNLASNPWKSPVFLAKPHEFPVKSHEFHEIPWKSSVFIATSQPKIPPPHLEDQKVIRAQNLLHQDAVQRGTGRSDGIEIAHLLV